VPDERRSHVFLWIAAGLLVLAVGYRVLGSRAPEPPPVAVDRHAAAQEPRQTSARVYVHVAGAVRHPGLYRLGENTRVGRAVRLAGGPTRRADLAATNLAARVEDGQQILVPVRGAAATPAAATTGTATPAGPISLASATQAQLEELDGIGPTLAARILEYRDEHGGFRSIAELGEVDGIGEVRLAALREAVQP
jgi:competence protein ComEA